MAGDPAPVSVIVTNTDAATDLSVQVSPSKLYTLK